MSKEAVKQIVLKAKQDEAFMKQLLADPEKTAKGYDLTPEEIKFLKGADRKTLEGLSEKCFELEKEAKAKPKPKSGKK
ncbi:hypothetical protein HY772_09665 [Candidatus Woesearchaeota archaeon]|nr:hypothetical protein [Candidatus Woesearchaeota archaeon]